MSTNNYLNLFLDADIANQYDQERYSGYLDVAIAQEGVDFDNIVGLGEEGTGSKPDLYIIERHRITVVSETGLFKKAIVVKQVGFIAPIARLRGTQEGYKGTDVTITAHDSEGSVLFKIVWGLGGPDWVESLVARQRDHLFKVISEAMDRVNDAPPRPSVSYAPSKAGALVEWATDVVKASGVEVTGDRVEEHANMVAAGIRIDGFMKLCAPYGVDDLNKFYPNGKMPDGDPIDTFDDLYGLVVARVGSAPLVDREIDLHLAASWGVFVNGCRETYA